MGRLDQLRKLQQMQGKAIETKKYACADLNEATVKKIFDRCLAKPDTKEITCAILFPSAMGYCDFDKKDIIVKFDANTVQRNKQIIQYLFGQLYEVHAKQKSRLKLSDFFINYFGTQWTQEEAILLELLYLGCLPELGLIDVFNNVKGNTTQVSSKIRPTYTPTDLNFPAWWEEHKSEWETEG